MITATRSLLLRTALSQVGIIDPNGNTWWKDVQPAYMSTNFGSKVQYCAAGFIWCEMKSGMGIVDCLPPGLPGSLWVPSVRSTAMQQGRWIAASEGQAHAKPADAVIFDWNRDGRSDHIGRLIKFLSPTVVQTVEFNTSRDGSGSDIGCWVRTRSLGDVQGFVTRPYVDDPPKPVQPPEVAHPVMARGSRGPGVARLQSWLMSMYPAYAGPIRSSGGADGIYGAGTFAVVVDWQRRSGLVPDGIFGAKSWSEALRDGFKG